MSKKKLIAIIGSAVAGVLAIVLCLVAVLGNKDSNKKEPETSENKVISAGDNNNINDGDMIGHDTETATKDKPQKEEDKSKDALHTSAKSVFGYWYSNDGDYVNLLPNKDGNKVTMALSNGNQYQGTFETDDKTYIKINCEYAYENGEIITSNKQLNYKVELVDLSGDPIYEGLEAKLILTDSATNQVIELYGYEPVRLPLYDEAVNNGEITIDDPFIEELNPGDEYYDYTMPELEGEESGDQSEDNGEESEDNGESAE